MRSLMALGMRREIAKRIVEMVRHTSDWSLLPIPIHAARRIQRLDPAFFNPDYHMAEKLFPYVSGLEALPTQNQLRQALKKVLDETPLPILASRLGLSSVFVSRFLQGDVGVSLGVGCAILVYLLETNDVDKILETSA